MPGVADEKDVLPLFDLAFRLAMHLAHQRTGRIDIQEFAPPCFGRDGFGHAVCGKDDGGIVRHFVQFFDEDCSLGLQRIHDVSIVHDLVADIDRRTVFLERPLDDFDGPVDSGAKSAGGRDQ